MESGQELKYLGFLGIYRESFRSIFRWKKIFFQITLSLILPLCIISLSHSKVSELFFGSILKNPDLGAYTDDDGMGELTVLAAKYGSIAFWLSKVVYFTFYLAFSLLATSAVVDTVFGIYTNRDVTFGKAVSVVPKVFSRLTVTFLWSLTIYFMFNLIFFGIFVIWFKYIWTSTAGIVMIVVIMVLYVGILSYMIMIWQLANVVSILEDIYGRHALKKGGALMKGKKGAYLACFLLVLVFLIGVHVVFELFVVISSIPGTGGKIFLGLACLLLVVVLELLRLVSQTVVYLVCKSHHKENIEEFYQAHHLGLSGRVKDVHHEQLHV